MAKTYKTFGGYGVDVASNRSDDLDMLVIEHVSQEQTLSVLDLGSGAGGQSLRMAKAGAVVTAVDRFDFATQFAGMREENCLSETQVKFIQSDVLLWLRAAGNAGFYDYALLQRVIHYFTYEQAVEILCRLKSITTGKLFISVTGIESAVGETYAGRDVSLSERFCVLEKSERETFMILEPVCLYSEKEFQSLLVDSGWNIEKFWTSAFGNSKAVCS